MEPEFEIMSRAVPDNSIDEEEHLKRINEMKPRVEIPEHVKEKCREINELSKRLKCKDK